MGVENLANIIAWKWDATPLFRPESGINGFIVADAGTGPAIAFWDVEGVTQPTVAEVMAFENDWLTGYPASLIALAKAKAKAIIDSAVEYLERSILAVAFLSKDEINLLRQWLVSSKAAVAGAGTFALFKTAWAGLPNLPDRTTAQMKTAAKNIIDANGNE